MRYAVVLNGKAGTLRTRGADSVAAALEAAAEQHGAEMALQIVPPEAVAKTLQTTRDDDSADAVIVGGGDGTISCAAGLFAHTPKPLGVLPLGTMNLFARSLKIPLDLEEGFAALLEAEAAPVDSCSVNDRSFVHHVALGLHPHLLMLREQHAYETRLGKILASFRSLVYALRRPPSLRIAATLDGEWRRYKTGALAVSNNLFAQGLGQLPYAADPQGGTLGVYIATSSRPRDMLRLTAAAALGAWHDNPLFECHTAQEVAITLRRRHVTASLDGELVRLATPLRIALQPGSLTVLRPRPEPAEQPAAAGM